MRTSPNSVASITAFGFKIDITSLENLSESMGLYLKEKVRQRDIVMLYVIRDQS